MYGIHKKKENPNHGKYDSKQFISDDKLHIFIYADGTKRMFLVLFIETQAFWCNNQKYRRFDMIFRNAGPFEE